MVASEDRIFVTSPGLPPFDEYVSQIMDLWNTGILTHQGPKYNELEKKLSEFLGVPFVPLFANGHLALQVLLRAQGWKDGEVITTPFTFSSTTMAIVECGLTPVFCDVKEDDFTIDVDKIEELITDRTRAILPVHVYGIPCDVGKIEQIARRHHLKVFYDAAHAFAEKLDGVGISTFGDASMFSFHATKVFNTVEGGALAIKDAGLNEVVSKIRQFGAHGDGAPVHHIGTNAKMTEIHAAMGICNLVHLPEYIDRRKAIFDRYQERLSELKGVRTIRYPENLVPNYSYFPIVFEDSSQWNRDQVAAELEKQGIMARKYFFPPTNEFEIIREMFSCGVTPVAHRLSTQVLCLPLHPNMSEGDADRAASAVLALRGDVGV